MTLLPDTDPILLKPSLPLTKEEILSEETQNFIADLKGVMFDNNGIGISAVQVGVLKRILIIDTEDFHQVMINPVILKQSHTKSNMTEGCLSFPGKRINIKRPSYVSVKYLDNNAKLMYSDLVGIEARVFLHEYEHLQGIVFTKYER